MSQDYDTKRTDLQGEQREAGGDTQASEDPLLELARIVHKNKQMGVEAATGRVEATDYFAGLNDFARDPILGAPANEPRVEPSFGTTEAPPVSEPSAEPFTPQQDLASEPSRFAAQDTDNLWPEVPTLESIEGTAREAMNRSVSPLESSSVSVTPGSGYGELSPVLGQTTPSPEFAGTSYDQSPGADLEQKLTADLEDELIGALRQSVDAPQSAEPRAPTPEVSSSYSAPEVSADYGRVLPTAPAVESVQAPVLSPETPSAGFGPDDYAFAGSQNLAEQVPVSPVEVSQNRIDPTPDFRSIQPQGPIEQDRHPEETVGVSTPAVGRPAIDEDDLFAALNPAQGAPDISVSPVGLKEPAGGQSGIDTLFADLDFPDPADRQKAEPDDLPIEPLSSTPKSTSAPDVQTNDDIDDMSWPAAAAAVPQHVEEETPPPPGGYDLDAVARAMQESDPSLKGSGVLPPHSPIEQAAAPHGDGKSRRGLYVAAGVLGVAVLGATGFFLTDSSGISVPDGPPPVISGLQEPLKVFPDETPGTSTDQSAKLIYDRVGGASDNGPDRLVGTQSPEPADLPPPPATTGNGADLMPGATKQVRTLVVRPDGTIITNDEPPAGNVSAPATSPAGSEAPRVVTTTPVTSNPAPTANVPSSPASAPTSNPTPVVPTVTIPITPEPAVPQQTEPSAQTPAIVAGTEPAVSEPTAALPASPVPSVLPRKKPAAPVQVAQAPTQITSPVQPAPANGPIDLTQPAAAATPVAPVATNTSGGSIAPGTYIVQVTSQRSSQAASNAYSGLQRQYPGILGSRNAVIVAADLGDRGTFYRARIPTGSRDEAIRLCEQLQGAGGDCFVRRQP